MRDLVLTQILVGAALATLAAGAFDTARAAVIEQRFEYAPVVGYGSKQFEVLQFDDALGTLTGVTLELTLTIDQREQYAEFIENSNFYLQYQAFSYFDISDTDASLLLYHEVSAYFLPPHIYPPPPGPLNVHKYAVGGGGEVIPLSSDLSMWIGGPARTATFYAEEYDGSEIDTALISVEGGVSATAVVRYYYAVPEPATWALMIAGFGLTGATLRRRLRAALEIARQF